MERSRGCGDWRCFLLTLALSAPAPALAQGARLQLDQLSRLADQAAEVVDVTIDPSMLQLTSGFLSGQKADEAAVKALIGGLKGVYVKSFEFEREGAYTDADLETVLKQLKAPGWSRIVDVKSKRDRETVAIYMWREGDQSGGLAIVAAEPKELTIVNIVGPVDLAKLGALQGRFGIPQLPLGQPGTPPQPPPLPPRPRPNRRSP